MQTEAEDLLRCLAGTEHWVINHYNLIGKSMAETVDELTVSYTDGGIETVKELDKIILSKGAWATVIYKYQDWNRTKEEYGPDKYTIRRYQKRNGEYQQKSKFNISSAAQAAGIIDALQGWIKE
tara:strand:- start:5511 stop:5882 length:372 start_codon:yes stop_codon:yes gene_type:complete